MRIGTIHAFCQSLLRRFPLEAALSPHFRLMEDIDGHAELDGAREDAMAQADPAALATLAGLVNAAQFGQLVAALRPHHAALAPLLRLPVPAGWRGCSARSASPAPMPTRSGARSSGRR